MDTQPGEEKVLIEEKLKKASIEKAAAPTTLEDIRNESFNLRRQAEGETAGVGAFNLQGETSGVGAAAAAAVLTAMDEDEEGGEEAECPRGFDYFSDGEEES